MSPETFSQLLGMVYDAALDEASWVWFLESIRTVLDGNYASLIVRTETQIDI